MTEWNLQHREKLLQDIADGLEALAHQNPRLSAIRIRFFAGDEQVFECLGAPWTMLRYIACDIYWDEESNWAKADRAVVDTY